MNFELEHTPTNDCIFYLRFYLLQICTQRTSIFFFLLQLICFKSVWMKLHSLATLQKEKIKLLMWKYLNVVRLCNLNCSLIQRFKKTVSQSVFNGWLTDKFLSFTIGMIFFFTLSNLVLFVCLFLSVKFLKLLFGWFKNCLLCAAEPAHGNMAVLHVVLKSRARLLECAMLV